MLQIEKDMIHDFYHNTREEIKELEARISNYDTLMQNSEESHRTDIISHMQKVKHLEYEHLNSCDLVKGDAMGDMKEERTYFSLLRLSDAGSSPGGIGKHRKGNLSRVFFTPPP